MLVDLPPLLRDVVAAALAHDPTLRLIEPAVGAPPEDLAGVDVLVVGLAADAPTARCAEALGRHPGIKVLALEALGRTVSRYELRPARTPLGALSPAALVDAVHAAVAPPSLAPGLPVVIARRAPPGPR